MIAIVMRCPKCKLYRSLSNDTCKCGMNLKAARRAGQVKYYARIMVNGARRRFPLGNKLKAARAEESRLLAEYADTGHVKSRQKFTVDQYYEKFFMPEQKRKNKSWDKVKLRYEKHLRPVFGHKHLVAVEGHHIQAYINQRSETKNRQGQHPQPSTINRELAVLKRLFNQAKGDGLFSGDNPVYGKSAGPEKKNYGTALSQSQAAAVINALPDTNRGRLIEFLLATGLRFGNAARLKWTDIDMINTRLRPIEMKAGPDGIPLTDWAIDILNKAHQNRKLDCNYIFPHRSGKYAGQPYGDIRGTWKNVLEKAGLQNVRIHDLRHTFGSWLGDEKVNEKTIAALLNHKQTSTTSRYTHPGDDALKVTANKIQRPEAPESADGAQSEAQNAKIIAFKKRVG